MSSRTFHLSVDRSEGALERVLSVVRRRRLGLERLSVDAGSDDRWDIAIRASSSDGEAGLALKQFTALIDVRAARVDESA